MNMFEFFHAAAFRMLGHNNITAGDVQEMGRRLQILNQGFGGSTPIDYSDPLTKLAYMFSHAPRHAIIWREYMKRPPQNTADGSFTLNSIGTACGPEIIGILEGITWSNPGLLSVSCFETEPTWKPFLKATLEEYRSRKGNVVSGRWNRLSKGEYTIGSMVLSEIVKQSGYRSFRTDMTQTIGPADGLFLDITNCRMADGTEPYLSNVFSFGFFNFTREGLRVKGTINAEMNACQPCYCKLPMPYEPKMNFYFPRFR